LARTRGGGVNSESSTISSVVTNRFKAVDIEVDGGLAVIGFSDHSHTVAVMLDVLPFRNRVHCELPFTVQKTGRVSTKNLSERVDKSNRTVGIRELLFQV
jgi:hypothetical protein